MEYLLEKKKRRTASWLFSSSFSNSDWENLPDGILDSILDRLVSVSDYARFSTVCRRWRGVALDERNDRTKNNTSTRMAYHQLPMLMMLPFLGFKSPPRRSLLSVPEFQEVTNVNFNKSYFPNEYHNLCIGSSFGWVIVCKDEEFYEISLHNQISSTYRDRPIHLPRLDIYPITHRRVEVSKAVLSAPPDSASGYVIAVIFYESNMIAFLQVNKQNKHLVWTCRVLEDEISDLIFDEDGELLLVDSRARVFSSNFNDPLPAFNIKFDTPFPPLCACFRHRFSSLANRVGAHIVKSTGGDLLLVIRFMPSDYDYRFPPFSNRKPFTTVDLILYKLDATKPRWIKMDSLGNDILFLGHNAASISVSKFDFPRCSPGSIYFTDILQPLCVRPEWPMEEGVFNFQCLVKRFDIFKASHFKDSSIWVVPTL